MLDRMEPSNCGALQYEEIEVTREETNRSLDDAKLACATDESHRIEGEPTGANLEGGRQCRR